MISSNLDQYPKVFQSDMSTFIYDTNYVVEVLNASTVLPVILDLQWSGEFLPVAVPGEIVKTT